MFNEAWTGAEVYGQVCAYLPGLTCDMVYGTPWHGRLHVESDPGRLECAVRTPAWSLTVRVDEHRHGERREFAGLEWAVRSADGTTLLQNGRTEHVMSGMPDRDHHRIDTGLKTVLDDQVGPDLEYALQGMSGQQ